jgi:hypothetical protein
MINLFCGYDEREAIGFHVFVSSVLARASAPVAIKRIDDRGLPVGSNSFTFSRFLVPFMMGFKGHAIFADAADMLMLDDVAKLDALYNPSYAVQVVKHAYRTRNPQKYVGTDMQCPNRDYPRKNWASLMLINCEHRQWADMSPDGIAAYAEAPTHMLGLQWLAPAEIGELPSKWNRLVDEGQEPEGAALLHWTAGIPAFKHYANAPGAHQWHDALHAMLKASE